MPKLIKLAFLSAFFAVAISNTAHATFPKDKQTATTVTTNMTPVPEESTKATKAELKKELNQLANGKGQSGGGKSKIVAALLAFFLGSLGIHSFYMGQKKKGFIQLGATVVGTVLYIIGIADFVSGMGASFPTLALIGLILIIGVSIWAFIDFIRILTGGLAPEEGFDS